MAVENLYATSLSSGTVSGSANATGAPNGTYTTDSANTSWTARFAMGDPSGPVAAGTHTITARVRKVGSNDPTVDSITLYAGGISIATVVGSTAVTSTTSQDVSGTFAASLLSGYDLSTVEVEIATTAAGGSPSARGPVQLDAITWSGNFNPAPNAGTSTGGYLFAGAGATGQVAHKGTATGAYDASKGSVTGSRVSAGTSAGGYAYAGSVAGDVPANGGTATGSYDLSGSGVGDQPPLRGTALGGYSLAGSASGMARQVSEWSSSATATTLTGLSGGIATGGYRLASAAVTGTRESAGQAISTVTFIGSAAGEAPANGGTASSTLDFSGAAQGSQPAGAGTASSDTGWYGSAHGSSPLVPEHIGSATGTYSLAVSGAGDTTRNGFATVWLAYTGLAVGEGQDPRYLFEPPTYRKFKEPPLLVGGLRIPMQASVCVVRIDGALAQLDCPTTEQLRAAGEEGIDWFLGGHVYEVPMAVGLELQAAGYTVTEI